MITFEKVTKKFGDNPPSVDEVSFVVGEGEFVFLTGHSGSGKTTLMKLLTKEYLITTGEIVFEGEPISKLKSGKLHKHRRKLGVVYQDYRLLPELNVWENVALALEIIGKPKAEIEERVTDLLDLVQLTDRAFFFPAELSGGESQRVGIARALATAPNVLLADEPTGNLDADNTLMIARLFSKIHELGTTVLFATHDPMVLEHLGHRRIKLEKGKVIEDLPAQSHATPKTTKSKPVEPEEKVEKETPQPAEKEAKAAEKEAEKPTPEIEPKKTEPTPMATEPEVKLEDLATSTDEKEVPEIEEADQEKTKKGINFHFSLFGRKTKAEPDTTEKEKPVQQKLQKTTKPTIDIIVEEL